MPPFLTLQSPQNSLLQFTKFIPPDHTLCLGTSPPAPAIPQTGEVTVEMDPVKVEGVAEWLEPKNKKGMQAFLGFANFYWRFIQDFLHHAWGSPEQMAFSTLKYAVTSGPVLLFPDNNSPFQVKANSSDFATGAVLLQQSLEDEKWHPVAFYSKSLNAFVVDFTRELYQLLSVKLHNSTAYHLQSNSQTKCVNQELEQYFCLFCNKCQDDWNELLPNAEFQYNNHVHASTQVSLLFLNTGQHPCIGFKLWAWFLENEAVNKFVDWMKKSQEEAWAALVKAKDNMVQYYDCERTLAPKYQPRD
ncbi:hypothetical protein E4T56_gene215 [Termitomyces sp. T112]|nr:hypothetical protein E4T56_gene215 [Termitomyces sp. T112]